MGKKHFISFAIIALSLTQAAVAENASENVMVIAVPDNVSATTMGKNVYFTKSFDLLVTNMGQDSVDLSKGCFVGYDKKEQAYKVDIIDEKLTTSQLAGNKPVQGNIGFSAETDEVYNVQFVRFQQECN